jgi:hypothetical protein
VTLAGWQGSVERVELKVRPGIHEAQVESAVAVPATKPWPGGQFSFECTLHLRTPALLVKVPSTHASQRASELRVPATKPCPGLHCMAVCGAQEFLSATAEYIFTPSHGSQRESVLLLPLMKPSPTGQALLLCGWQGDASLESENFPLGHTAQNAFAVSVAAVNPLPAPHAVTVTALQGLVERPGLNDSPAGHCSHPELSFEVPGTKPKPSRHGKFE